MSPAAKTASPAASTDPRAAGAPAVQAEDRDGQRGEGEVADHVEAVDERREAVGRRVHDDRLDDEQPPHRADREHADQAVEADAAGDAVQRRARAQGDGEERERVEGEPQRVGGAGRGAARGPAGERRDGRPGEPDARGQGERAPAVAVVGAAVAARRTRRTIAPR